MSGKTTWAIAAVVVLVAVGILAAHKIASVPEQNSKSWPVIEEKKILSVLDQMLSGPHGDILSVPPDDGRLLRLLAEATGAKNIVEIGTSNGYAALWFCMALRERVRLAMENFKRAGVDKLVTIVEGDAHKMVTELTEPIDIVYLDADKDGNLDYLKKLLPLVHPGGLILAHDAIDSAERMKDYLDAVNNDPALETITLKAGGPGICVTIKKRRSQQ